MKQALASGNPGQSANCLDICGSNICVCGSICVGCGSKLDVKGSRETKAKRKREITKNVKHRIKCLSKVWRSYLKFYQESTLHLIYSLLYIHTHFLESCSRNTCLHIHIPRLWLNPSGVPAVGRPWTHCCCGLRLPWSNGHLLCHCSLHQVTKLSSVSEHICICIRVRLERCTHYTCSL